MIEWKRITEFDKEFYISNSGLVINTDSKVIGNKDSRGYIRFGGNVNGKYKTLKVHRLVAKYFLKGYSDNLTVNHKDFDKTNNRVNNLELISATENTMHYITNKKKLTSSSKTLGIGFHKGLNKWTARGSKEGIRYSLGVYQNEQDAIHALEKFNQTGEGINMGKGKSNIGRKKYTQNEIKNALIMAHKIGIRKASASLGISSTTLSIWRKVNGQFLKEAE